MLGKKDWSRILVMVVIFFIAINSCDSGTTNDGKGYEDENGGEFVLNKIPSIYDGKYAILFFVTSNENVFEYFPRGFQNVNIASKTITLVPVSNGSVSLPMWNFANGSAVKNYLANETVDVIVCIFDSETMPMETLFQNEHTVWYFPSVTFINGDAICNFNESLPWPFL